VSSESLRYLIGLGVIVVGVAWMARKPADWRPWGFRGWPPGSSYRNGAIYIALAGGILDGFALWRSLQP
jgi:hypothetical protein